MLLSTPDNSDGKRPPGEALVTATTGELLPPVVPVDEATRALKLEVRALNRRIEELARDLALEKDLRVAEASGSTRIIADYREELARVREQVRESRIENQKLRILQDSQQVADKNYLETIAPFLTAAEAFVAAQLSLLYLKPLKVKKGESLGEQVSRLEKEFPRIADAVTELKHKGKNRATQNDELREKLKTVSDQAEQLQENLERESKSLGTARQHLSQANAARELLQAEVTRLNTELGAITNILQDERRQREEWQGSFANALPSKAAGPYSVETVLKLPTPELCASLKKMSSPQEAEAFFSQIVKNESLAPFVTAALDNIMQAQDRLGDEDSVLTSKEFLELEAAREVLVDGVSSQIESQGAHRFVLAMPANDSTPYVSELSVKFVSELLAFSLVKPEWSHGLLASQTLTAIDHLPAETRAALVSLCQDEEQALLLLLGSQAIRCGVHELQRLYQAAAAKQPRSPNEADQYKRKIQIAVLHNVEPDQNPKIKSALGALDALNLVQPAKLARLWAKFTSTDEALKRSFGILGFDLRNALALGGILIGDLSQS